MALQDSDLFLTNRTGVSYKTEYSEIKNDILGDVPDPEIVHVSTTPKDTPNDGDLWWCTADITIDAIDYEAATLYVWLEDAGTWTKVNEYTEGVYNRVDEVNDVTYPDRSYVSKMGDYIDLRDFGEIDPTGNDDAAPIIHEALSYLRANGGGTLNVPPGTYSLQTLHNGNSFFRLYSNTRILAQGEVTFRADVAHDSIFTATSAAPPATQVENIEINGIKLDANNNYLNGSAQYVVNFSGCAFVEIRHCTFVNWRNGVRVASNLNWRSANVVIDNNQIIEPATANAYYPLSIQSTTGGPLVTTVTVSNNRVVGNGGSFSTTNSATGDQINLQGVQDFVVMNNISFDGGEMGITVSRLSQRGSIFSNSILASDSHGINIGSGYMAFNAGGAAIPAGSTLKITTASRTSNWEGTVAANSNFTHEGDSNWYGVSAVNGHLNKGDVIYIVNPNDANDQSNTRTVNETWYTRRISCTNNTVTNVATDVENTTVSSGIYIQQCEEISCQSNIVVDQRDTPRHEYGFDVRNSTDVLVANNEVSGYTVKEIVLRGEATRYAPLDPIISPKENLKLTTSVNGSISVLSSYARIDTTLTSQSTGSLATINGGYDGYRLVLMCTTNTRSITINDTGNIRLTGGTFTLNNVEDTIEFIYNGNRNLWVELSRRSA